MLTDLQMTEMEACHRLMRMYPTKFSMPEALKKEFSNLNFTDKVEHVIMTSFMFTSITWAFLSDGYHDFEWYGMGEEGVGVAVGDIVGEGQSELLALIKAWRVFTRFHQGS